MVLLQTTAGDGHHEVTKILKAGFAPDPETGDRIPTSLVLFRPELVREKDLNCPDLIPEERVRDVPTTDEDGVPYQWSFKGIPDAEIAAEWAPVLAEAEKEYGSAHELDCQFCGKRFTRRKAAKT